MSEQLAQLKKNGKTVRETTLWTNPNPSDEFGVQTITLSQSYQNFDVIRIYHRSVGSNAVYYTDFTSDMLSDSGSNAYAPLGSLAYRGSDASKAWVRIFSAPSTTTFTFNLAVQLYSASTTTAAICKPTKIVGLK